MSYASFLEHAEYHFGKDKCFEKYIELYEGSPNL